MRKVLQLVVLCTVMTSLMVPSLAFGDAAADYKAKCQACHGPNGVPSEGMAKSMGLKPLGGDEVQAMSDADLASAIANGKGKMKGMKGTLTDDQISDLVKYIRSLKK